MKDRYSVPTTLILPRLAASTFVLGLLLPGASSAQNVTCATAGTVSTYNYTGSSQTFTVPTLLPGQTISNIHIEAYGASGADAAGISGPTVSSTYQNSAGGAGGLGGFAEADLTTPSGGTTLGVYVGGAGSAATGGFNGGGNGGTLSAGAGGGASDVRLGGVAESNRVIVAGGGGGGGRGGCQQNVLTILGGDAGDASAGAGINGTNSVAGFGGAGGTIGTGGAAGIGCPLAAGTQGSNAVGGIGGAGGPGATCCCIERPGGGGGGGGFVGGGGGGGGTAGNTMCQFNHTGAGGGGAGGSSNVDASLANPNMTSGVRSGDGLVKLCYTITSFPAPVLNPSGIVDDQAGGPTLLNTLITYTITYNEDIDSSTFSALDLANVGTAAISIGNIQETTPGVFSVQITPTTIGTLQLSVGPNVSNTHGVPMTAAVDDDTTITVFVDSVPPSLSPNQIVDDKNGGPVAIGTLVTYTATFSEDINASTFTAADVSNAGTSTFTVGAINEPSPGVFTVQITPTSAGTLVLTLGPSISDLVGNPMSAAVSDDTTIVVPAPPTPTPSATPTPSPSATPTPTPSGTATPTPTPNSRVTVLNSSEGNSQVPAPSFRVLQETSRQVQVQLCYDFRNFVAPNGNVFGVISQVGRRGYVANTRLTRRQPCMSARLTRAGTYTGMTLQTRSRRPHNIFSNLVRFQVN